VEADETLLRGMSAAALQKGNATSFLRCLFAMCGFQGRNLCPKHISAAI
jgi:hypothetical protein